MVKEPVPISTTLFKAVALLVLVAAGARIAWELLQPLLPLLAGLLLLLTVFVLLAGRR